MNQSQAVAVLRKVYGPKLGFRINKTAPTPEQRGNALAALTKLGIVHERAKAAMLARREELLRDPEYLRLVIVYRDARDANEKTRTLVNHYRIQVDIIDGLAFTIQAQGDTWAEVVAKAQGLNSTAS